MRVQKCLAPFLMAAMVMAGGLPVAAEIKAAQAAATDEKVEQKTVTGKLGMVRPHQISVEDVKKGSYAHEYLLPLAKDVRLHHVREFAELQQGDTVKVTYQQTSKKNEKGEKILLKTLATDIALVKSAASSSRLTSREQP